MKQLINLSILGGLGAPELIIILLIIGLPIAIIVIIIRSRKQNKQ